MQQQCNNATLIIFISTTTTTTTRHLQMDTARLDWTVMGVPYRWRCVQSQCWWSVTVVTSFIAWKKLFYI